VTGGRRPLRVRWKERLADSCFHPRWIHRAHLEPALRELGARAQGVLLDVGCGRRPYEPLFAGRVRRYVGTDWPGHADRARPDVVADALALPVRSGAVDTLLATELMEHVPSADRFLQEAARVLRAGGLLLLTVPFLEPLHEEPRDFFRFTPHGLRALLERHGFACDAVRQRGGWWSVALGSFVSQALYEWANPERADGSRRDHPLALALVLPLCATSQLAAYALDRLLPSRRYAMGYVVAATRASGPAVECAASRDTSASRASAGKV
jgi:SAM-dependent methyltransferase